LFTRSPTRNPSTCDALAVCEEATIRAHVAGADTAARVAVAINMDDRLKVPGAKSHGERWDHVNQRRDRRT